MSNTEARTCTSRLLLRRALMCVTALATVNAHALDCGTFSYPHCQAAARQFTGGFEPGDDVDGFGGGNCTAKRTPVVFVHGNGDSAIDWDARPSTTGSTNIRSVYDEFRGRGFNDCELFGITYLSDSERANPLENYHRPEKYKLIIDFIEAVKAYTGKRQVDIVAHSLGVSMTLAALQTHDAWASVRRFVNIAGGIRGLDSCLAVGNSNPLAQTCGSQNLLDGKIFGFYPYINDWMECCNRNSLREMPEHHPDIRFYTIHAGAQDQIHCTPTPEPHDCKIGAEFSAVPNVRAQLDIGSGATPGHEPASTPDNAAYKGGDADGVGHFHARINAGAIIYTMLRGDCRGIHCRGAYKGSVVSH